MFQDPGDEWVRAAFSLLGWVGVWAEWSGLADLDDPGIRKMLECPPHD
jgi:hypothetical protein